jgi:hypothetical protein
MGNIHLYGTEEDCKAFHTLHGSETTDSDWTTHDYRTHARHLHLLRQVSTHRAEPPLAGVLPYETHRIPGQPCAVEASCTSYHLGHLAGKAALEVTNFTMLRVKIAAMFGLSKSVWVG